MTESELTSLLIFLSPVLLMLLLLLLALVTSIPPFQKAIHQFILLRRYKSIFLFPGIVVEKKLFGMSVVDSRPLPLRTRIETGQVLFAAKNADLRFISKSHWRIEVDLEVRNGRGETLRLDDVTTKIYWDREDVVLYQDALLFNQDEISLVPPKHSVNMRIVFDLMADDTTNSAIYLWVRSVFGLFLCYLIKDNTQLRPKLTVPSDSVFVFQDVEEGNLLVCNGETLSDVSVRHRAAPAYLKFFKDIQNLLEQHLALLNSDESTD